MRNDHSKRCKGKFQVLREDVMALKVQSQEFTIKLK